MAKKDTTSYRGVQLPRSTKIGGGGGSVITPTHGTERGPATGTTKKSDSKGGGK